MAFSQSEQSSILQEELTCPVCLDLYRNPYLLPCGHNFCKNCLDHLKQQAERGRFRCPECRNSHKYSINFQKNFKLANISDDYLRQRRFPAASVSKEDDDKERASACASAAVLRYAVKTCLKCEVSMCQEHVKPHLELSVFREHPLTDPVNDLGKRKCPDHEEMYRYYCMDDKVYVCNACTIEGGHSGHTIKTLRNTMKDLKGKLEKQLYRAERKHSMAEKKFQEQKEKERQNKKCLDDCEEGLTRLSEEIKAKVLCFITRLQAHTHTHCDTNEHPIQKNISKICQDRARLQEVRCSLENLMQENDPFRFIEVQCLSSVMLFQITYAVITSGKKNYAFHPSGHFSDVEEEEQVENEEETVEEDEDNEDDDDDDDDDDEDEDNDDDDDSSDEMRSDGEEEDEEDEGPDLSDLVDDLYSPEEEGEDEEEDDEEEDDGEEGDLEERRI
uniref:E3 ubiquitin/ISG15 ligase TRIM25-like n=1 Tax=Mola mola TaxID=94237 RepID=A0A3Q4BY14_MOLML